LFFIFVPFFPSPGILEFCLVGGDLL